MSSPRPSPEPPPACRALREALRGAPLCTQLIHHTEIDSTQAYALAHDPAPGTLIVADRQHAGRGRRGRSWHAPPGGLWCTLVLATRRAPTEGLALTLLGGLAVRDAIERTSGLRCGLRWPNDVVASGRKLAGVLVDVRERRALFGIGIDLACDLDRFPPALRPLVTTVAAETGRAPARAVAVRAVLEALAPLLALWEQGRDDALRERLRPHVTAIGRRVRVLEPAPGAAPFEGRAIGLDPRGALLVARAGASDRPIAVYSSSVEVLDS